MKASNVIHEEVLGEEPNWRGKAPGLLGYPNMQVILSTLIPPQAIFTGTSIFT